MANYLKLNMDINLKRYAVIKVATSLWENQQIREKIDDYFHSSFSPFFSKKKKEKWCEITIQVINNSHLLCLPKAILPALRITIFLVGEKLCSWMTHVIQNSLPFTKYLCWTTEGLIDEKEIFHMHLKNSKTSNTFENDFKQIVSAACCFGEENFIKEYETKIIEELKCYYPPYNIQYGIVDMTMFMWMNIFVNNSFSRELPLNFKTKVPEMLEHVLFSGHIHLIKYLWSKMDWIQKERCFSKLQDEKNFFVVDFSKKNDYQKEKIIETFIFLINNADEEQIEGILENFVVRNFLIENILHFRPFQKFFPEIFNVSLPYADEYYICKLFFYISPWRKEMCTNKNHEHFEIHKSIDETSFAIFWKALPVEMKKLILSNHKISNNLLIKTFKLVMNDNDLNDLLKAHMVEALELDIEREAKLGKLEILKEFLNEVLVTEAEKIRFKKNAGLRILKKFVVCRKFRLAEDLLNILTNSDEEGKRRVKSELDTLGIFSLHFPPVPLRSSPDFNDNYNINKYLRWQNFKPEEIANIKKILDNEKLLCKTILKQWRSKESENKSIFDDKTEENIMAYMGDISGSKEEVSSFIKNVLGKNERFIVRLFAELIYEMACKLRTRDTVIVKLFAETEEEVIYKLPTKDAVGNINVIFTAMIKFFSISPETARNLKSKIFEEIDTFSNCCINYYKNEFEASKGLISWLADGVEDKNKKFERYVNSGNVFRNVYILQPYFFKQDIQTNYLSL